MHSKKLFALTLAVAMLLSAGIASAQDAASSETEKPWFVTLDLPVNTKYMWRGLDLVDDLVFQPSFEAGYQWVSLMVWANMDLTDVNEYEGHGDGKNEFTEIDYMLHLTPQIGITRFEAGAYWYTFPNTEMEPTLEVYAGVGLDVISQPTLLVYYDVELVHGVYANLAFSHTIEDALKISDSISMAVDLGAGLGLANSAHNEFYYGVKHDGLKFTDASVSVGFPISIGEHITFTPTAAYSVIVDQRIRQTMGSVEMDEMDMSMDPDMDMEPLQDNDNYWFGLGLAVSL